MFTGGTALGATFVSPADTMTTRCPITESPLLFEMLPLFGWNSGGPLGDEFVIICPGEMETFDIPPAEKEIQEEKKKGREKRN